MDFSEALLGGVPLMFIVLGLVEWSKRLGLAGKWLLILSMLIGLVFGVLYQISLAMPNSFATWFVAVGYGLGVGIVASGVYDAIRSATKAS
jgi:hypothetical protein